MEANTPAVEIGGANHNCCTFFGKVPREIRDKIYEEAYTFDHATVEEIGLDGSRVFWLSSACHIPELTAFS